MVYLFGPYSLNPQARDLSCRGTKIKLQPKTIEVLQFFLERPSEIVTREQLMDSLWPGERVHANNLTQHVFLLRQAFAEHTPDFTVLVTVSGKGYRLVIPVEVRSSVKLLKSPAWRWYARGRLLLERNSKESLSEALECFETALREDTSLADAYASVAEARIALATYYGFSPAVQYPKAETAAEQALTLHPQHADAYCSVGDVAFLYRYDAERALAYYDRALGFGSTTPRAAVSKGLVYAALGRHVMARQELENALQLNPVSLELLTMHAAVDLYAGNLADAVDRCNDVLQIDGTFERAGYYLAMCSAVRGDVREVRRLRQLFADSSYVRGFAAVDGFARGRSGDALGAQSCFAEVTAVNDGSPAHWLRAEVLMGLGNEDEAMRELNAALNEREPLAVYMGVHPFFKSLWRRRDFQDLAERLLRGGYRLEEAPAVRSAGRR